MHQPDYLMTVVTTSPSAEQIQEYLDNLSERFNEAKILVSGYQVIGQDLRLPSNVEQLNYIRDIKEMLEEMERVPQEK
jgi:hypothetical protein